MVSETLFVLAFLRYLFNLTAGAGVEEANSRRGASAQHHGSILRVEG